MVKRDNTLIIAAGLAAVGFIFLTSMRRPELTPEEQAISGTPIVIIPGAPIEDQPSDLDQQIQELGQSLQDIRAQQQIGQPLGVAVTEAPTITETVSPAFTPPAFTPLQNISAGILDFATFGILGRDFAGQVVEKGRRFGARFRQTEIAQRLGVTTKPTVLTQPRRELTRPPTPIGARTAIRLAQEATFVAPKTRQIASAELIERVRATL